MSAYENMKALICRPDCVVYKTIVGALWKYGVVWANANGENEIDAQIYDSAGKPRSNVFQVTSSDTKASSYVYYPSVAMDDRGDFVVAWIVEQSHASNFDVRVHAQRFNLAGRAQGSEMTVDRLTGDAFDLEPKVAMDSRGDFVIAWVSDIIHHYGIFGQRFGSDGIAQRNVFQVDGPSQEPGNISLAMDSRGDFVIAWQEFSFGSGIYVERFDLAGRPQGSPIQVAITKYAGQQGTPVVAMDSAGDFVVTWQLTYPLGSYPSLGIFAQRYDRSGKAQGGIIEVTKNDKNSDWENPAVAMNATGDFVVSWEALDRSSHLLKGYARQYHSSGAAKGAAFMVSSSTTSNSLSPIVAMDSKNNFAVVWTTVVASNNGFTYRIYSRRFKQ